jgi:Domain of unknown function (DUF5666)
MKRHLAILMLCLAATAAMGGEVFNQKPLAEGFVSSVDPYLRFVTIDNGLLTIDITTAVIRDAFGQEVSVTNIRPGAHIATVIRPGNYASGDALSASVVQILQQPVGTITGKVEAIDVEHSFMTVNGQMIFITPETVLRGSVAGHDPRKLADMKIGDNVTVFLDGGMFALRAQSVYTIPPTFADTQIAFTSTLRKIEGDTWTVRNVPASGLNISTFNVVSGTSIEGFIRPGDVIQVFARVDDGVVTAEAIELGRTQCPNFEPFPVFTLHGIITAITATSVTITETNGDPYTIVLNDDTIYSVNDPRVGDAISVLVEKHGETYVARRVDLWQSLFEEIIDTVLKIEGNVWTIGTKVVTTNPRTEITGNPKVGDRVKLVSITTGPGQILALRIDKQ